MVVHHVLIILFFSLLIIGCEDNQEKVEPISNTATAKEFAEQLGVTYRVITNRADDKCDKTQTEGLCFQAQLELSSPLNFTDTNWALYFSHMSPVQMDSSEWFDIVHVNGDLHRLQPTDEFEQFQPGQSYTVPFRAGFWHLSQSDVMPNYYLVTATGESHIIPSTVPVIDAETGLETAPHAAALTLANKHFKRKPTDKTEPATAQWLFDENEEYYQDVDVTHAILPTPVFVAYPEIAGKLDLASGIAISSTDFTSDNFSAALDRLGLFGVKQNSSGKPVRLIENTQIATEGYHLTIAEQGINIEASSATGVFYAFQSIASLLMPDSLNLPFMTVKDEPRFEFRGMHLDVSRNFKSKQFVMQLLDQMAAYKLNKFHFHLADDEGWRVEIPDLPELTEVGAFRCHDLTEQHCLLSQLGVGPDRTSLANGYYSIEEYKEILAYAKARHIQVIPSMDMPGHSRAAIKSMAVRFNNLMQKGQVEQAKKYLLHDIEDATKYTSIQFYNDNTINACLDSSYDFIAKVIDELAIMHQQAGQPLTKYHIGADETAGAWVNSPACSSLLAENVMGIEKAEDIAAYFIEKVAAMLAKRGISAAGWSDGMGHTETKRMPKNVQTNAWSPLMWDGHKSAHEQANRGWQVVLSSPDALYFDFPYEADANERGYYWAARRINTKKVFEYMPENLPAHAEIWRNREELPYQAKDEEPLRSGVTFHGMQGQLWSETIRTDEQASYMIFPRMYALAERAWHRASWELRYPYQAATYSKSSNNFSESAKQERAKDWLSFANQLGKKVLVKAEGEGVFFRLPTVGAAIKDGKLELNSIYPGLPLEYKFEGHSWLPYQYPVPVRGDVEVRSVSPLHDRRGRSLVLEVKEATE